MTTETATRDDWHERSKEIGESAFANIAEMVGNLERANDIAAGNFDWDEEAERLGFRQVTNHPDYEDEEAWVKDDIADDDAESACRKLNPDDYPDEDDARRTIEEDPLSLQVRSGWTSLGETLEAEEFEILLSTGGPAVRIIGDLSGGEPTRARLQVQDWFKPWTDYYCQDGSDTLLTYCRCFYFGE